VSNTNRIEYEKVRGYRVGNWRVEYGPLWISRVKSPESESMFGSSKWTFTVPCQYLKLIITFYVNNGDFSDRIFSFMFWERSLILTILCPQLGTTHCSLKFFRLFGKNLF